MLIKAKLRKIGNSLGVIIPKEVITFMEDEWQCNVVTSGDHIYLEVITNDDEYMDLPEGVITKENPKQQVITKKPKEVITEPVKRENVITELRKEVEKVITKPVVRTKKEAVPDIPGVVPYQF